MYGSVTLLREQCPQAWRAWRQGMCCVQISFAQLAIYFCVKNNIRVRIVGIQLFYKRQISADIEQQSFFISK